MGNLSQWIAAAQQNQAQLLYTFGGVPTWASGGTQGVLSGSRSSCSGSGSSAHCTSTLVLNGAASYAVNSRVVVSGVSVSPSTSSGFSGTYYLSSVATDAAGNTVISYPQTGALTSNDKAAAGGSVTYTSAEPPSDLNAMNETCHAPLAGVVRPGGDCIWAEFVTKLMQYVCGVSSQPASPLVGSCKIRNFETWNEFNYDGYWTSNYTDLAKMGNDAAAIVRTYCGDCLFVAGSTTAGGAGYHQKYVNTSSTVSPRYDVALGQLLDAWHAIPNASLPDAVSYHAYPSRNTLTPIPFPETNVSHSSPACTAANVPNVNCLDPVFNETGMVRNVLNARTWAAALPLWNTEGGYDLNSDVTDGVDATDTNTGLLRQAYVSRWMLAIASTGTAVNMWYVWDDPCWGTMWGQNIAPSKTGCPTAPAIPAGATPGLAAWKITAAWLNGATFAGPCSSSGAIWSCQITKPGGYTGMVVWTTAWLQSATVAITQPSPYHQWRDLDGNITQLNGASSVTVTNRPILVE